MSLHIESVLSFRCALDMRDRKCEEMRDEEMRDSHQLGCKRAPVRARAVRLR